MAWFQDVSKANFVVEMGAAFLRTGDVMEQETVQMTRMKPAVVSGIKFT